MDLRVRVAYWTDGWLYSYSTSTLLFLSYRVYTMQPVVQPVVQPV